MNRNSNTQKVDSINIGSDNHSKLISLFSKSSNVLSKVIKNCRVDNYNNVISLVFSKETIYSTLAQERKKEIQQIFSEIVKNPVEIKININS